MAAFFAQNLLKLSLFPIVLMLTFSDVSHAAHIPTTITSQSTASVDVTSTTISNVTSQESQRSQSSEESQENIKNNNYNSVSESGYDVTVRRQKRDVRSRRSVDCNPCQSSGGVSRSTEHVVQSLVVALDSFDRDQLDVAKERASELIRFYEGKMDATKPDHDTRSSAIRQQHVNLQFPWLPFNIQKEHISTDSASRLLDDLYEALYFANNRLQKIIEKEEKHCQVYQCDDVTVPTRRLLELKADVTTVLCEMYLHIQPAGCAHANHRHHQRGLGENRDAMFYQFYVTLSYIEQALIMTRQLVYLAQHDQLQ